MMMTTETMSRGDASDAELVTQSLRGSRDAFGQIVTRHQSLICSLAYSATGNLTQSEDLAQDTFVAAWKQLAGLREPAKLRSWLCGIVRNLSHRNRRSQEREPVHRAEPMDALDETPAREAHPPEQAISREEEGILWRSLERMPETYREPLILFYREHESIEQVALALELSEEAVRQRLVRGRKLLHEQVLAFVEGTLKKSSPGKAFTLGVLAALPVTASTAKATAVGATMASSGAAAKSAVALGTLSGWLAVLGSSYVTLRAQADDSKSPRERQFVLQMIGLRVVAGLLFFAILFGFGTLSLSHDPFAREIFAFSFIFFLYALAMLVFIHTSCRRRQIQIEEKTFDETEWKLPRKQTDAVADSSGTKTNSSLKALKFKASVLVLSAIMIFQAPWRQHFSEAVVTAVIFAVALILSFVMWRNRPRYQSLRQSWAVWLPVMLGVMTLFIFNFRQYQAHASPDGLPTASRTEIATFNLVVVLAYSLFAGFLVWKRRSELR